MKFAGRAVRASRLRHQRHIGSLCSHLPAEAGRALRGDPEAALDDSAGRRQPEGRPLPGSPPPCWGAVSGTEAPGLLTDSA